MVSVISLSCPPQGHFCADRKVRIERRDIFSVSSRHCDNIHVESRWEQSSLLIFFTSEANCPSQSMRQKVVKSISGIYLNGEKSRFVF